MGVARVYPKAKMRAPRSALRDTPLLFAHRGGAKLWPENTLMAFRGALELGVQFIETDVHATRDGVLVVHHDDRVDRTTNGKGLVRDYSCAELQQLDAGYRFTENGRSFPLRGQGVTIPTLEEVVALDGNVRFNIEIKQKTPDIVEAVWRFIDDRKLADRFVVAAAHDPLVQRFRKACGGVVATSAGSREARLFWAASRLHADRWLRPAYDALQVPARLGPLSVVDARLLEAARREHLQVHVWTIDDPIEMQALLTLGVDGIMSDRPDLLSAEAERFKRGTTR